MKEFFEPEVNVVMFSVEDIITTSNTNDDFTPGENEGGGY